MRAGFIFSSVLRGVRRNIAMTIALVLSTSITLAFVGAALLAQKEISRFRTSYEGKLFVSIYLCAKGNAHIGHCTSRPVLDSSGKQKLQDGIPELNSRTTAAQQATIVSKLMHDPIVASYSYVSEKEQFARAKRYLPADTVNKLHEGDLAASYTIKLKDIKSDYNQFRATYSTLPGVYGTSNSDDVLKRLLNIIDGVRLFAILIALVVLVASILLIMNTLQVAAAQRRNETSIMRLVGASRWMTELPFLLEAVFAAVIGGLIAAAMVWLGKTYVLGGIFKFQVENGVIPNLNANDIIIATGIALGAGILVAAVTAFATLRLYVKL